MVDIQIEPHADGVGGDEEIYVTILVELDLGVACAGAKRAHDNSSAAFLALEKLGDGINVFDRKADDGGARLHTADLFGASVDKLGHTLTAQKIGLGDKSTDNAAHRIRPKEQRFVYSAGA